MGENSSHPLNEQQPSATPSDKSSKRKSPRHAVGRVAVAGVFAVTGVVEQEGPRQIEDLDTQANPIVEAAVDQSQPGDIRLSYGNPDQQQAQPIETSNQTESVDEVFENALLVVTENFHLDFQQPYIRGEEHVENFILDQTDPLEYLHQFEWRETAMSRDEAVSAALEHLENIELLFADEVGTDLDVEKEFLEDFAQRFPILALSLPERINFLPTVMLRGQYSIPGELGILTPKNIEERTPWETYQTLFHETHHYFKRASVAEQLSPYMTYEDYMKIVNADMKSANAIFDSLLHVDTYADESVVDEYFDGYLNANTIVALLKDLGYVQAPDYKELETLYENLGLDGDPGELSREVLLIRSVQYLHEHFDDISEKNQQIYQSIAGRMYYDIHHGLLNMGPEHIQYGLVQVQDIIDPYYVEDNSQNLRLQQHADLSVIRYGVFAVDDGVENYRELFDEFMDIRSQYYSDSEQDSGRG